MSNRKAYDFKYATLIFQDTGRLRVKLPAGCDTLDDLDLMRHYGYAPLATREGYVICAHDGRIWIIGYALDFDGVHMLEAVKTDIAYDDNFQIEEPIK